MRLVAVMQYLRVVIVTILATVVSHLWIDNAAAAHFPVGDGRALRDGAGLVEVDDHTGR